MPKKILGLGHVKNKQPERLNIKAGGGIGAEKLHEDALVRLDNIEQRRTRNRALALILTVVFIMAMTIAVVHLLLNRISTKPMLQFIQSGHVDESYQVSGVIARDEKVLLSPINGIVRPLEPEAAKVGDKANVAMLLSPAMQNLYNEWRSVTRDVAKRRLELIAQGQSQDSSVIFDDTDMRLAPLLDELRKAGTAKTVRNDGSLEKSIDAMLYSRNLRLDEISFDDARLAELQKKQVALDAELQKGSVYIQTGESGYVSYMSDGKEKLVTPDLLANINEVELLNLLTQPENYINMQANVHPGQPIYRISNRPLQYMAVLVKGKKAQDFHKNDRFSVYLPEEDLNIENCIILSARDTVSGCIVNCKTSSSVETLLDRRRFQGEMIVRKDYGLKVPLTALTNITSDENGERIGKLMIINAGATKRIDVQITAQDERYAIVHDIEGKNYLKEGAVYVENPQHTKEGISID